MELAKLEMVGESVQVLGDAELGDQSFLLAVLGDVTDPGMQNVTGATAGEVPAGDREGPGRPFAPRQHRLHVPEPGLEA